MSCYLMIAICPSFVFVQLTNNYTFEMVTETSWNMVAILILSSTWYMPYFSVLWCLIGQVIAEMFIGVDIIFSANIIHHPIVL